MIYYVNHKILNKIVKLIESNNENNIKVIEHEGIDDILSNYYEIKVNNRSIIFLYKPLAGHSYNSPFKTKIRMHQLIQF